MKSYKRMIGAEGRPNNAPSLKPSSTDQRKICEEGFIDTLFRHEEGRIFWRHRDDRSNHR